MDNKNTQSFATQISVEEYAKQSKNYTQKALEDLQKQMNKKPINKPINKQTEEFIECESDDSDSDNSDSSNWNSNLLIKSAINNTNNKSQKTPSNNDLYRQMLGQRELEVQKNIKLERQISKLNAEIQSSDLKMHYLKLDLNNSNIERDEAKLKIDKLTKLLEEEKNQNKKMERENFHKSIYTSLSVALYVPITLLVNYYYTSNCFC